MVVRESLRKSGSVGRKERPWNLGDCGVWIQRGVRSFSGWGGYCLSLSTFVLHKYPLNPHRQCLTRERSIVSRQPGLCSKSSDSIWMRYLLFLAHLRWTHICKWKLRLRTLCWTPDPPGYSLYSSWLWCMPWEADLYIYHQWAPSPSGFWLVLAMEWWESGDQRPEGN